MIFIPAILSQFGVSFGRIALQSTAHFATKLVSDDEFRKIVGANIKKFVLTHYDIDDSRILGLPAVVSKTIAKVDSEVYRKHIVDTLFKKMLPDVIPVLESKDVSVRLNSIDDLKDPEKFITVTGDNPFPALVVDQILKNDIGKSQLLARFLNLDHAIEAFKKINLNIHMIGNVVKISAYDPEYLDSFEDNIKMAFTRNIYPVGVLIGIGLFSRQDNDTLDNELNYGYTDRNNFSSYNMISHKFKVAPRLENRLDFSFRTSVYTTYKGKLDSKKQKIGFISNDRGAHVLPTSYDIASLEGFILQILQQFITDEITDLSHDGNLIRTLFPDGKSEGVLYKDSMVKDFTLAESHDFNLNGHSETALEYFQMGIHDSMSDLIKKWRVLLLESIISNKFDSRNLYIASKNFSYKQTAWLRKLYSSRSNFDVLKPKGHENVPFLAEGFLETARESVNEFITDEFKTNSNWLNSWFDTSTDKDAVIETSKRQKKETSADDSKLNMPINDIVNKLKD